MKTVLRQNTVKALINIKKVFDHHNIVFWLEAGTLLGAVRDKRIIDWDTDVDLGMWLKDFNKIRSVMPILKQKGFNTILSEKRCALSILSPHGLFYPIQIDFYSKHGDFVWTLRFSEQRWRLKSTPITQLEKCVNLTNIRAYSEESAKEKIKNGIAHLLPQKFRKLVSNVAWRTLFKLHYYMPHVAPRHHFETLETIRFYGETFRVPSDTQAYLTVRYGNWRTPRKDWRYYQQAGERRPDLLPQLTDAYMRTKMNLNALPKHEKRGT